MSLVESPSSGLGMVPAEDLVSHPSGLAPNAVAPVQLAVRLVPLLTGARRVSLLVPRGDAYASLVAAEGLELQPGRRLPIDSGIMAEALQTRRPLLIEDLAHTSFPVHPERGYLTRSCMVVPVEWENRLYALVCAADPSHGPTFTPENLESLHLLAHQVGASLHAVYSALAVAAMDPLTDVPTRRVFLERLVVEVQRARRFGHPVSLLMLDVNNLQRVNEREGDWVGDRALRGVAAAIRGTVRRIDLVARFGGDEFALILPETEAEASLAAAYRVATSIQHLPEFSDGPIRLALRATVGAATLPPASSAQELLRQARWAMHLARKDREGVRHWDIGTASVGTESYSCTCRACGKTFLVASLAEQQSRRYCSKACAGSARRRPQHERNLAILSLREAGMTLRSIADRFGITEERVRQICASH